MKKHTSTVVMFWPAFGCTQHPKAGWNTQQAMPPCSEHARGRGGTTEEGGRWTEEKRKVGPKL